MGAGVIIAIAMGAAVAGLLGFISSRPGKFSIERSRRVHAPVDAVFALLSDFHHWGRWSPWEKLDPDMQRTYGGPEAASTRPMPGPATARPARDA